MTEPPLTDWHTLLTTVRARFPDAPGLPDEFSFDLDDGVLREDIGWGEEHFHNDYAALCVMLDWAMRFGAWWTQQRRKRELVVEHVWNYGWTVDVTDYTEKGAKEILSTIGELTEWSHHAAYFAAVQAIVGDE